MAMWMISSTQKISIQKMGRLWQYFVQGLGGYVGILLSLVSSLTIIYNFVIIKFIHPSLVLFFSLLIGFSIIALGLGWLARKTGFWYGSVEAASEINPYLDKILGKKDQLGWEQNLINTDLNIEGMKLTIAFYKDLGYDTTQYEEQFRKLIEFKKNIEDILKNSTYKETEAGT